MRFDVVSLGDDGKRAREYWEPFILNYQRL
jgi:hypothetical protein